MSNKTTHLKEILAHLKSGKTITRLEAVNLFGCYNLPARIYDLKKLGYNIEATMKVGKNRNGHSCNYAEYKMIGE